MKEIFKTVTRVQDSSLRDRSKKTLFPIFIFIFNSHQFASSIRVILFCFIVCICPCIYLLGGLLDGR